MTRISAQGVGVCFDAATGLIENLTVEDRGRIIAPLHRAPWVGSGEVMPPGTAPHLAVLAGDFFCAPFAGSEDGSPLHGWTANAPWVEAVDGPHEVRAVLSRTVFGATVIKELAVSDGHPFVYQRHVFVGGAGRVPVANHANVAVRNGALIRTSAKSHWETPKSPQESDPQRGRSALCYPARSTDPTAFPGLSGPVDLTRYPWNPAHEDFVAGIEGTGHTLGWTAVTRPVEGDLFLSLRDARALPMTMLWHSNGGRDYAPWSGRHVGCLGVEEGAAATVLGLSSEADLAGPGALTLSPAGMAEVRHVIGAIAWAGEPVATVTLNHDQLTVVGDGGATRTIPIRAGFLP